MQQQNMCETMPQSRTISVIIPVYNVREYLTDCIQSVISQTYKDLEIILVDDGSTDGSGDLCDLLGKKDNRIQVFHQSNAGVSEARNTGIKAATGNYLGFIDADDWIEQNMYQKLIESMIQNNTDVSMCGYYDYPKGMNRAIAKGLLQIPVSSYHDSIVPVLRRNGYFTSMCNKLFSKNIIFQGNSIVMLDTDIAYGEDEDWLFRVLSLCHRISFVPEALYHWRPREGSTTRIEQINERHLSLLRAKRKVVDILPADNSIQKLARGRLYNDCYALEVYAYLSGQKDYFKYIKNQIKKDRRFWIKSPDIPFVRKVKVMILSCLMTIKASGFIVRKINQF